MLAQRPPFSYRVLSIFLFLFWVVHALQQAIKYRLPSYLIYRLGFNQALPKNAILMHASSVGEVALLKPLVENFVNTHPVVLTTFTLTGYKHALKILPSTISVSVLPIDFYPISRLFFARHRFKAVLIAETEIWPESLYQCKRSDIPLLQINARLTEKSLQTPRWVKNILYRALQNFDQHLTRTEQDKMNLISMQVNPEKILISGNLKYAGSIIEDDSTDLIGRPYILFASTHAPEEKLFAELIKSLDRQELSVIAPRHPVRAKAIITEIKQIGLEIKQRSKNEGINDLTEIYLADTIGEMIKLMSHAKLVVMGGSFTNIGGHNIVEPASLGKAVITGPSDDNIRSDIELLKKNNAIIQVENIQQLKQQISLLLEDEDKRNKLAKAAKLVMQEQGMVKQRYLEIIQSWL